MKEIIKYWSYLSKTDKEVIKGIIFVLSFSIFMSYFNFSEENIKIGMYSFFLFSIGYLVFFETRKIEKLLIQNITQISFILIIIFLFFLSANFVNINKEIFYIVGAVFAFWYSYMKYSHEKELEMYKRYEIGDMTIENMDNISKWKNSYYLNKNGYISKSIYELINSDNSDVLTTFINEQLLIKEGDDENSINNKITTISNRLSQFTIDKDFYKNMEGILIKYSKFLSTVIKNSINQKEKRKYTVIRDNLNKLLTAMEHGELELNKLNT